MASPIPRSDALKRNIHIFTKWLTSYHINVRNFFTNRSILKIKKNTRKLIILPYWSCTQTYIQLMLHFDKIYISLKNENICYIRYSKSTSHINYITCPNVSIYKLPMMSSSCSVVNFYCFGPLYSAFLCSIHFIFHMCSDWAVTTHICFLVNSISHVYNIFHNIEVAL